MTEFTSNQIQFIESFERRAWNVPFLNRVIEWNLLAKGKHHTDIDTLNLQHSLVKEELRELIDDGIIAHNPVEFLDAICDLFVVSSYEAFICRISYLHSVRTSDKTDEEIEKSAYSYVVDLIDVTGHTFGMRELITDLIEAVEDRDYAATVNLVAHLMHQMDVDIHEAMHTVLDSNDSKMPKIDNLRSRLMSQIPVSKKGLSDEQSEFLAMKDQEVVDFHSEQLNVKYKGRYSGISGTITPSGRVVFRNDAGKIVKPCTFFEPTEDLLNLLPDL